VKQKIFLLLSLTLFILSFTHIFFNLLQILPKKNFIDFFVYQGALEKFLNQQNPYNFLYGQPPDKVPFNYPPSALLLLLPLKLLPLKTAQIILTILSFLAFWLTFWLILKVSKTKISLPHFLIILAFFNQTFPVKFTLVLGQINLIVLGLTYGGMYLYFKSFKKLIGDAGGRAPDDAQSANWRTSIGGRETRDRIYQFFSIMFFSFASSLKIFPLFTLPFFLIIKDYMFVFSVAAIFLVLNLLPSFNLFKQYYFQIVPGLSRTVGIPNFYDQSFLAFLLRLNLPIFWAKILTLVILFSLFTWILIKFYRHITPPPRSPCGTSNVPATFDCGGHLGGASVIKPSNHLTIQSFSLIFALFSIGGLFSWQHHLVFAYPLIFILYLKLSARSRPTPSKLFLFFFIWLIFVFHFKTETSPLLKNPFMASYQTITIFFIIIISLSYSFTKK